MGLENDSDKYGELVNGEPRDGVSIYLGTTGMGKTHLALRHLQQLHDTSARPMGAIVVDSARSKTIADFVPNAAPTLEAAIREAWGARKIVRWVPSDENGHDADEDFDKLVKAARTGANVRLLIDELSFWARNPGLFKLCRVWRASNVSLLFTAQHVGADVGQSILACNPKLFLFRVTATRSLEFLSRWLDVDEEQIRSQGRGEFVAVEL